MSKVLGLLLAILLCMLAFRAMADYYGEDEGFDFKQRLELECIDVGDRVQRCQNIETTCYITKNVMGENISISCLDNN